MMTCDQLHDEFAATVVALGIELDGSGLAHNYVPEVRDPEQISKDALDEVLCGGANCPLDVPSTSSIPLSEYKCRGYVTLAFPTLFPFGRGHLDEPRERPITFTQWVQHLEKFHDGRFASHPRWGYFIMNTHERQMANDNAQTFINASNSQMTFGELRELSSRDRKEIFTKVSKWGATLRNTPAFFAERRKELMCMCEQIGDPHAFATNSFADTYCPYLAQFIISHAMLDKSPNWATDARNPFQAGVSEKEQHSRRCALMKKHPHLAASFFALKTELYFEHIAYGVMDADAFWSR